MIISHVSIFVIAGDSVRGENNKGSRRGLWVRAPCVPQKTQDTKTVKSFDEAPGLGPFLNGRFQRQRLVLAEVLDLVLVARIKKALNGSPICHRSSLR